MLMQLLTQNMPVDEDVRLWALQELVNARREYQELGRRSTQAPFYGRPNPPKGYLRLLDRTINRLKKEIKARRKAEQVSTAREG